jgi:integrase/recombinase XerD
MQSPTFHDYVQDRKYTRNVSPKTLLWYEDVWRSFGPYLRTDSALSVKESVREGVQALLAKGIKPVSINSWLTGVRAFALWLWNEGYLKEKPKVQLLKCEQKVIQTFTPEQSKLIIGYKGKKVSSRRAHVVACVILDCGLRISEVLTLRKESFDFDNLVIKVKGKGNKERLVPMSFELRKVVWKWSAKQEHALMFGTRNGTPMTPRNFQRDFAQICKELKIAGVRCSPHTLRHTFAASYLRAGGNLFYLSKILGHTSVKTTERYLQSLNVSDFQAVHNGLSILNRGQG